MPLHTNYYKIGLFVIVSFLVLAVAIVAFSGSFQERLECETFFDQSVQGLSEGSDVKFRGFKVGQVSKIGLSKLRDRTGNQLVHVSFNIDPEVMLGDDGDIDEQARAFLQAEVGRGLRAYLTFQGVTGSVFIDLDYTDPEKYISANPHGEQLERKAVFIPNAPAKVVEAGESLARIVKSLETVDFGGISGDLKTLIASINVVVQGLEKNNLSGDLHLLITEIRQAANQVSSLVKSIEQNISADETKAMATELKETIRQMRLTLKRTEQLLSSSQSNLPQAVENLRIVSENLRELSDMAKRYPSQILFGDPPKEIKPSVRKKP